MTSVLLIILCTPIGYIYSTSTNVSPLTEGSLCIHIWYMHVLNVFIQYVHVTGQWTLPHRMLDHKWTVKTTQHWYTALHC